MLDDGRNYTCAIKIFQATPGPPRGIDLLAAPDFPADRTVPGYLCQAARLLVGLTQQELHVLARVSKKSINDYENGFIEIRVALAGRLVAALREAGARFVAGEDFVGVIVNAHRTIAAKPGESSGEDAPRPEGATGQAHRKAPATARTAAARRAPRKAEA